MWLGEDIEPDNGGSPFIEQPTSIVTRPLNEKEQDDRMRIALGLTSDDVLPAVDDDTLLSYHRYLAAHLMYSCTSGASRALTPSGECKPSFAIFREDYGEKREKREENRNTDH